MPAEDLFLLSENSARPPELRPPQNPPLNGAYTEAPGRDTPGGGAFITVFGALSEDFLRHAECRCSAVAQRRALARRHTGTALITGSLLPEITPQQPLWAISLGSVCSVSADGGTGGRSGRILAVPVSLTRLCGADSRPGDGAEHKAERNRRPGLPSPDGSGDAEPRLTAFV
ncbi:unnamed protein product [Coccothraustes coccothraustes]